MAPRPRTVSDAEVFAAAARVVARVGPARLTLAAVGAEAGLTAGALVQRYGSKRALLLAVARRGAAAVGARVAAARARHPTPLAALDGYAARASRHARAPEALAHHLAFLQMDLVDPDFRREAEAFFRAERAALRALLDEAVAAGELAPCGTEALARAAQAVLHGARLVWAVTREGALAAHVRADLAALLAPHRGTARQPTRPPRGAPRDPASQTLTPPRAACDDGAMSDALRALKDAAAALGPGAGDDLLRAVATTCYLIATADGELADDEAARLAGAMDDASGALAGLREAFLGMLTAGRRPDEDAVMGDVAARLADPAHRRLALRCAAEIAYADGVLDFEEELVLLGLARRLDVPEADVRAFVDEARRAAR